MSGWIKLHRKLTEWEWYSDVNTSRVFLHLLLVANHKDKKWRGIDIKRGQRLTSLSKLAEETNLSVKNIRTAIKRLKTTNEVASYSNAQHTVFTIVNYESYQSEAGEAASKGQAEGKQGATNKNVKNEDNVKNTDFNKFWDMYGKKTSRAKCEPKFNKLSDDDIKKIFEALPDYVASTPNVKFRKDPQTWLNGKCWDDEVERVSDYNYVLDEFNAAMSSHKHVNAADIMTTDRISKLNALFSMSMSKVRKETIGEYFRFIANCKDFDEHRNGRSPFGQKDLTWYLSEKAYQIVREARQ